MEANENTNLLTDEEIKNGTIGLLMTASGKLSKVPQLDCIESQITYTTIMTNTL